MEEKKRKWFSPSCISSSKEAFHRWGSLVDLPFHFFLLTIPWCFTASQPTAYSSLSCWPGILGCGPQVAHLCPHQQAFHPHVSLCIYICVHCLGLCLLCVESKGNYSALGKFPVKQIKWIFIDFLSLWALLARSFLAILVLQAMVCHFLSIKDVWSICNCFWGYLFLPVSWGSGLVNWIF